MSRINLEPNLERPDDFYEALIAAHEGMEEAESHAFNARLIFILANHLGSQDVLVSALDAARTKS